MTMVTVEKVSRQDYCKSSVMLECELGGGGGGGGGVNIEQQESTRSSTCVDEETAASSNSNSNYYADTTTTTTSSSSSWLQLGLPSNGADDDHIMLDLNLAQPSSSSSIIPALYLHPQPIITTTTLPLYNYYTFPSSIPQHYPHPNMAMPVPSPAPSWGFIPTFAPPSSSDFKNINPSPSRPNSGLWFTLLPSLPQSTEPCLPPLSKKFVRIKDERMTVRLVIKYVTNKLGLDSKSQVEIRCRGQALDGLLTLKEVRDKIWNRSSQALTLLPNSSTSTHLMLLHYAISSHYIC